MAHFADLARYIGVLCSSGSRMIEIEAHKKEAELVRDRKRPADDATRWSGPLRVKHKRAIC